MSETKTTAEWSPAVSLDLYTADGHTFAEVEERFKEWVKTQPLPPFDAATGWQEITPQRAESWLMRNAKNRKAVWQTIEAYGVQIANRQWKRTGQPIIFTDEEILLDGQHRLWACYLTRLPIDSYVVTGVPHEEKLFAFVDNVRPRSGADALYIAGVNGLAAHLSAVVKQLAERWDQGLMRIRGRAPMPQMSNMEVLAYVQEHPGLAAAAKFVQANYKAAARRLDSPLVATFLAWKIIELHGEDPLDRFMTALLSNSLPDGHAVAALQKRLDRHERAKTASRRSALRKDMAPSSEILALAIKAFNLMTQGKTPRSLSVQTDESFPQLIDPAELAPPPAEAEADELALQPPAHPWTGAAVGEAERPALQ
jgi:hypothetical protein